MVALDIHSDPICPWCYIGKARLDRALAARGAAPFAVRWRPFRLNPDMPREGADRGAYLAAKFGAERAAAMLPRIEALAAASGVRMDFARIRRVPNTLDAHRLIRWAGAEGRQTAVVDELFRRYFGEGEDISEPAVLIAAAAAAGLPSAGLGARLASDEDVAVIEREDAAARAMGIGAVPTFLVAGRYVIEGAQETEVWERVIDELAGLAAPA
jgi:predicted DsbA family dithiol-disulfide isomerase